MIKFPSIEINGIVGHGTHQPLAEALTSMWSSTFKGSHSSTAAVPSPICKPSNVSNTPISEGFGDYAAETGIIFQD
jgi:hypothetical protein